MTMPFIRPIPFALAALLALAGTSFAANAQPPAETIALDRFVTTATRTAMPVGAETAATTAMPTAADFCTIS